MTAVAMPARPARPSHAKRNASLLAAAAVVVWAVLSIEVDWTELADVPGGIGRIFYNMFLEKGVDWTYLPTAAEGMLDSIWIAWVGTIIGAALSLPIGFFGARNVSSGLISNVVRQVLNAIRAFPELVLVIVVFIPIAGLGAVAGALAVGLHSVGTLGKLTAEVVEGIDPGPVEAARAAGGRPLQVQRWGVLPQVLPEIVAFWLYRFEINIRAAAILGVVGAGGIGTIVQETINYRRWDKAGLAILVVIVATILIDVVSGWVRRRIIEGSGARRVGGEALEEPEFAGSGAGRVDTDIG
ncbi:MAG TPA: phosphonate ABC transporter, permease protein PhnE [Candidatus Limnocylindria bacterium]